MSELKQIRTTPMSVEQAYDLWFTVPKRPASKQERQTVKRGENFSITFQDIELAASSWGSGPPVLLLHGWGGHRGQLSAFVDPLVEAGYRVVAFDAPAHGDTPGTKTHGLEVAAAMQTVIEEVGPLHAVIAHSLGTMATTIALTDDQDLKVNKLVYSGTMRRLSDAVEWFARMTDLPPELVATMQTWIERDFGEDVWERTAIDKLVANLPIPALMFHDREDTVMPYQSGLAISKAWPTARLVTTSGLGHRRILRDPKVIEQAVEFIGDR